MNKKRDALRRGIRALLHDTSKELVSFGGDEPHPVPAPPAAAPAAPAPPPHQEAPSLNGGAAGQRHLDAVPAAEEAGSPPCAAVPDAGEPAIAPADSPRAADAKAKQPHAKSPRAKQPRTPAQGRRAAPVPPDEVEVGTAPPIQPEARTGVCRSYFVNHECWQVPRAYCNTALQVCVIRNCPVYHLHKDALERRFAKKFKHFW